MRTVKRNISIGGHFVIYGRRYQITPTTQDKLALMESGRDVWVELDGVVRKDNPQKGIYTARTLQVFKSRNVLLGYAVLAEG